jgi:hypothetical protein
MKAYRWLLRCYPRDFRARYAAEMERTFLRMLQDARARHGIRGAVAAWLGATGDAVVRGLAERRNRHTHPKGMFMDILLSDFRQAF